MTAMKPVLDLYIDANILLILAFAFWRMARFLLVERLLRHDFRRQLALLKSVLIITIMSPVLAYLGVMISNKFAPGTPMTVGDLAVAAYLNGDIAVPAVQFESLLNARDVWTNAFLAGKHSWATAAFAGLAAVSALYALLLARSFLAVGNAISASHRWRTTGRTDIRFSDGIGMPFAARGLWRRHVVLPSRMMMQPKHLRVVLAHEFQHLRSGDVEWEIAFEMLRPLFFWNPAFALWKRDLDHLRELSCDQAVLVSRRIRPKEYATCLLEFCESGLSGGLPKVVNVAFVSTAKSGRALESRLLAVFKSPKGGGQLAFLGSIVLLAVLLSLAAASVRKPGDWSHDRLMLSTIINLERLEAINRGN
jgi:beta-lactamase regulating signal transducer with metallopeptidase domain